MGRVRSVAQIAMPWQTARMRSQHHVRSASRPRLAANLDARHWRGCLPRHRLEELCHGVQPAEYDSPDDSREKEKSHEAWHVAKRLLASYVRTQRDAIMSRRLAASWEASPVGMDPGFDYGNTLRRMSILNSAATPD